MRRYPVYAARRYPVYAVPFHMKTHGKVRTILVVRTAVLSEDTVCVFYLYLYPEGTSACRLQRGPFVFTYVLLCVVKGADTFKIPTFRRPF